MFAFGQENQFRAIETRHELRGVGKPERIDDIKTGPGIRCCGQRHSRNIREQLGEPAESAIFGPEVVSPLAHAVSLVDGDKRNRNTLQTPQAGRLHEPFGRKVDEIKFPRRQPRPCFVAFIG